MKSKEYVRLTKILTEVQLKHLIYEARLRGYDSDKIKVLKKTMIAAEDVELIKFDPCCLLK